MSLATQISALATRVAIEFKTVRTEMAAAGGGDAQVSSSISLPTSPRLGECVLAVANAATELPTGVVWDSGGAPVITGRRLLSFVWDGTDWLGTYSPHFSGSSLSDAILSLSPIGYWKLDETSGTTAFDSSGNGHHGTYTGTVILNNRDGAPTFTDGYVTIPDADDLSIPTDGALTLFGLGYSTSNSGDGPQFYLAKGHWEYMTNYEYGMGINWPVEGRSSVATWWTQNGEDFQVERSTDAHPINQWVALAAPLGASKTALARFPLYRNSGDALVTTQGSSVKGSTVTANGAYPLFLGGRADLTGLFKGALRHIAIFDGELTPAQVGALMDAARAEGLIP